MDEWDSVSNDTPPGSVTDDWDLVSASQPSSRRRPFPPDNLVLGSTPPVPITHSPSKQPFDAVTSAPAVSEDSVLSLPPLIKRKHRKISKPWMQRAVIIALAVLLLALSGGGVFWAVNTRAIHFPVANSSPQPTVLLHTPITTVTRSSIPAPVSNWGLNAGNTDVAADISGNHLDGTISRASWSANHAPVAGLNYSLSFNGNGDLVSIPDSSELDFSSTDPMTISLWFDLSASPNVWHAIGKRTGCNDLTAINYQLAFDSTHGLLFDSGGNIVATGITSLQTGEWMQFGTAYDPISHTLSVFLNGQKVIEKSDYMLTAENTSPLLIAESGTCGYTFPGNINEVCIWRATLSESQMADLAHGVPCMK